MYHLEMPGSLTSARIERNQAGTKKVVTRAKTTVVIDCSAIGGDINQVSLDIGGDGRPRRNITSPLPGIVFPGFMAIFAGTRDYIELPFKFTSSLIVG